MIDAKVSSSITGRSPPQGPRAPARKVTMWEVVSRNLGAVFDAWVPWIVYTLIAVGSVGALIFWWKGTRVGGFHRKAIIESVSNILSENEDVKRVLGNKVVALDTEPTESRKSRRYEGFKGSFSVNTKARYYTLLFQVNTLSVVFESEP